MSGDAEYNGINRRDLINYLWEKDSRCDLPEELTFDDVMQQIEQQNDKGNYDAE